MNERMLPRLLTVSTDIWYLIPLCIENYFVDAWETGNFSHLSICSNFYVRVTSINHSQCFINVKWEIKTTFVIVMSIFILCRIFSRNGFSFLGFNHNPIYWFVPLLYDVYGQTSLQRLGFNSSFPYPGYINEAFRC